MYEEREKKLSNLNTKKSSAFMKIWAQF